MSNPVLPFNAVPIFHFDGTPQDDSGRRVVVNSLGGSSWPSDRWQRALENVGGVVVWGPCKLWYVAQAKVEGHKIKFGYKPPLKPKKFATAPYWSVLLDGYNFEMQFVEKELTLL